MCFSPRDSNRILKTQSNLPSDTTIFVQNLVTQVGFNNEQEAVAEGIRLPMSREQLRAEIQEGIRQLDNGESYDEETVFAEAEAEIARVAAERRAA